MRFFVAADVVLVLAQVATVCAITRARRGWFPTALACLAYAAVHAGYFLFGASAGVSQHVIFQFGLPVLWLPFALLIVLLVRGEFGRRVFLALDYGAYSAAFLPLCYALLVRQPPLWGFGGAAALIVLFHFVFLFGLLPHIPSASRPVVWHSGSLAALLIFVLLYVSGTWPHAVATGGWTDWAAFLLASAVAWVVFPMIYAGMRAYLKTLAIARDLELMVGEVAIRRATIDAARRQRHDLRHHRIMLGEFLLRGQVDKALGYLEQLDADAAETPTDKLVWCANDTLNAILSGCAHRAAAKGVEFSVEAHVEEKVAISDIDLVAVVANLVENAIRAAGEGGRVCVLLRQRELTFGMTVTNPVPAGFALSDAGLPCTTPGVGLESVRRVVARFHGELDYALADGVLACRAVLKTGR